MSVNPTALYSPEDQLRSDNKHFTLASCINATSKFYLIN